MTHLLYLVQRDPLLRSPVTRQTPVPGFLLGSAVARLYRRLAFATPDAIEPGVVSVPVLLIGGDRDRLLSAGGATRVLETVPDAWLELLNGVSHVPRSRRRTASLRCFWSTPKGLGDNSSYWRQIPQTPGGVRRVRAPAGPRAVGARPVT
jgi:hypothetical protein